MSRLLSAVAAGALVMSATVPFLARPVEAAVVHERGFNAVVEGWRSWYGSYGMGSIGTAWCVDHGPPAPDPALDYVAAEIDRPPATRRAMAWAVSAHGPGSDPVTAAAVQLVLHDLMGAQYPTRVLDVDRMHTGDLAGFGGQEQHVLDRARAIKAEALARSVLQPPLRLDVQAEPVPPGQAGSVLVRLRDANGAGVPGVPVRLSTSGASLTAGPEATTGGDGSHRFPFRAGTGQNRFEASVQVPDLVLRSYAPRAARAQRVARPARVGMSTATGFTAVPPRRLTLHKRGDAGAYLPVAGARFEVGPEGGPALGTLVTDAEGRAGPLELPPGRYQVREVEAPPGYSASGPWSVDLTGGDAVLEVEDQAHPGRVRVSKVDAATGKGLAGARLALAYDADRDGSFETRLGSLVTTVEPLVRDGLVPGNYELAEVAAPPGYRAETGATRFTVEPGGTASVRLPNAALEKPPAPPTTAPPTTAPRPATPPTTAPPRPAPGGPGLAATGARDLVEQLELGAGLACTGAGVVLAATARRRRAGP